MSLNGLHSDGNNVTEDDVAASVAISTKQRQSKQQNQELDTSLTDELLIAPRSSVSDISKVRPPTQIAQAANFDSNLNSSAAKANTTSSATSNTTSTVDIIKPRHQSAYTSADDLAHSSYPHSSDHYNEPSPKVHNPYAIKTNRNAQNKRQNDIQDSSQQTIAKSLTHLVGLTYILNFAGLFTFGITPLIALAINYNKRAEAGRSWLATHFDWQIKTFWYCFLLNIFATIPVFLGFGGFVGGIATLDWSLGAGSFLFFILSIFMFFISFVVFHYRLLRGVISMAEKKAIL